MGGMKAWAHQQAAIEAARIKPNLALFHDAGVGKTFTMIHILREDFNRNKRIRKTLVFAPLSVCKQWSVEFSRFSKIPPEKILVLTGEGRKRAKALSELRDPNAVVITNYESVQIASFYEELTKWNPEIVVLDESHRVKDSGSTRAKKIYPLCDVASRRFLLTGTPILNSLLDIFGQYRALNSEIFGHSFWKFRQRYFFDRNAGMPSHVHFPDWHPIPEAEKLISSAVAESSLQAKKSECLDLPPLIVSEVLVELSPAQRKLYTSMEKEFVAELKSVTATAEFAMTKSLRLRQILAGFVQHEAGKEAAWFDEVPRLRALREILESLAGRKAIIWTSFRPSYRPLAELVQSCARTSTFLTGDQSTKEKEEAIQAFNEGEVQTLISNPSAGGVGVNLASAPYAIYYDRSYSLEHFLQSQARNYRGGSEVHSGGITHYHLIAPGTIDEIIFGALRGKKSTGDALLEWIKRLT